MTTKACILVVDDEPIERQALTEILRLEGYFVTPLSNGEAAVDFLRTNNVDVMLLDLRMPGMGGMDVVRATNQISTDVEIVLLTAYGSMETAIDALRNRVHDYLLKPIAPVQIIESVNRALSRRQAKLAARKKSIQIQDDESVMVILEDDLVFDFKRRIVRYKDKSTFLTPAEGRLLKTFVENIGKAFTHRELVLLVQGYSTSQQEAPEILRPLVSRLRQKIQGIPVLSERIISIRGTGYIFE